MLRFFAFAILIPHKSIRVVQTYLRLIVEQQYSCWLNKCFIGKPMTVDYRAVAANVRQEVL
jgi:hypothetical protein